MMRGAFGGVVTCFVVCALVPSCRQIASIHERSSEQSDCAQCVDTACASEQRACNAAVSCASRFDCTLACDPTAANVLDCHAACGAQSGDGASIGAVDSCLATSCAGDCAVQCGGVLPIAPLQSASTCASCVNANCCQEASACAANAACLQGLECARSESTPDAVQTCTDVRYASGSSAYHVLDDCVVGSCSDQCAIGADWSCVGSVTVPVASSATIDGTVTLVELNAQDVPIAGLDVVACESNDSACADPLTPVAVSGADGSALLVVPTDSSSGHRSFGGYLQITDPTLTYGTVLAFQIPPTTQTGATSTIAVGTTQTAEEAAAAVGITYDPTKASVVVTAVDCANRTAPDVTFAVIAGDANPTVYYTLDDIPSRTATATDSRGTGFAGNFAPGPISVSIRSNALQRVVATAQLSARAGGATQARIAPTP